MTGPNKLADDCFAFDDKNRFTHEAVLAAITTRLSKILGDEICPLDKAAGRILAEDIIAPRPIPSAANAAVDGYAFAHAAYRANNHIGIAGRLAAGDAPVENPDVKMAMRIFTGAVMPEGFDTVAMQEDCVVHNQIVTIPHGLKQGANCRLAGEDFATSSVAVHADNALRATDIAAIAACGFDSVKVRAPLRVGILSTGNEIIAPGAPHRPAATYDANKPMLKALADRPYTVLSDLGHCDDDAGDISQVIVQASRNHDLIITTGGASRGGEDHLFAVLASLGKAHIWQIAIKPGRPMMFGQIGNTVLVALPGNPVAAMVCFNLYIRPMMAMLIGAQWRPPRGYLLPAAFSIDNKKPNRREFLRAWRVFDETTGNIKIEKFNRDGSGLISGLQAAEGFAVIDEPTCSVKKGQLIRFIPFSEMELV